MRRSALLRERVVRDVLRRAFWVASRMSLMARDNGRRVAARRRIIALISRNAVAHRLMRATTAEVVASSCMDFVVSFVE